MRRFVLGLMVAIIGGAGGLHLLLLQVIAWSGMFVSNIGEHDLAEAVDRTFNGEYPCELCERVQEAVEGSRERDDEAPAGRGGDEFRIHLLEVGRVCVVHPGGDRSPWLSPAMDADIRPNRPAVPPPRIAFC